SLLRAVSLPDALPISRLRRFLSTATSVASLVLVATIIAATQVAELHLPWMFSEWAPPDKDLTYRAGQLYWMNWGYTVSIWCIAIDRKSTRLNSSHVKT